MTPFVPWLGDPRPADPALAATRRRRDGLLVEVDGDRGIVRILDEG